MKYVHIGLQKSASSFLQENVFPKISKLKKLEYFYNDNNTKNVKNFFYNDIVNDLSFLQKKNYLFSNEALFGLSWLHKDIYYCFKKCKEIFDKQQNIIIVIRKPSQIINSLYSQRLFQGFNLKLVNENYKNIKLNNKKNFTSLNVKDLDYFDILEKYKSHFINVSIIKFEDIHKLQTYKKIFNLNKLDIDYLKKTIDFKKKINKSLSPFFVKLMLFLNKIDKQKIYLKKIKIKDKTFSLVKIFKSLSKEKFNFLEKNSTYNLLIKKLDVKYDNYKV